MRKLFRVASENNRAIVQPRAQVEVHENRSVSTSSGAAAVVLHFIEV